ncbi:MULTISPECIES: MerR family transcriptional regulator [Gammaproteobacteria]|uniref:Mercuric resistance operon regulatory protein n=1 Tax=Salinisphaera hydrothermalis (strain C41B8) TaxID=1304275 RepID=A0A084IQE4_SALHC|nr:MULTISPECIES: helix-turn-helix domain-containing protein [Gammaproteobacteria]KEZ78928.1 mercuric resistance operon regulatory protein [Salinisphaera hydrothermalis C41B8]MBO9471075.1 helix-turn-helix domain-containing protein [Endozoicomonas sp. G2_2]
MTQSDLRIGDLARRTGVGAATIRYYGDIGLLPEAGRSEGGQRHYGPPHVERLTFIKRCREMGFSQNDVRTLLKQADQRDASCEDVARLAGKHLESVRGKLAALHALEESLEDMLHACNGGRIGDCRIVECLANHE